MSEHQPNGCCDYHRHIADGCCHCETSVPPAQPTAAPESDVSRRRAIQALDCNAADLHSEVKLTAAEEDAIENAWVAAPKDGPAASRDPMYAAVERIVAERLRVVEGERDAAREVYAELHAEWVREVDHCEQATARAESAEADLKAMRAGIEALAERLANTYEHHRINSTALGMGPLVSALGDAAHDLYRLSGGDGR